MSVVILAPSCPVAPLMTLDPLAYLTAKSHGMDDECQAILEASGLSDDQITLPTMGEHVGPPKAIVPTHKANWPVKAAVSQSIFEKALLGQVEGLSLEDDSNALANGASLEEAFDDAPRNGKVADEDEEAGGWDMGDDINVEVEGDFVNVESTEGGIASSEAELWARNSPIPADHAAAGSFETAMTLLNRQVGAVNFEPLRPRFMEIYAATRTYLPANAGLPPLVNYVRRTVDETEARKVLPIIPRDLASVANGDLQAGYTAMRQNNLEEGVKIFKRILHTLMVNAVGDQQEANEVSLVTSVSSQKCPG